MNEYINPNPNPQPIEQKDNSFIWIAIIILVIITLVGLILFLKPVDSKEVKINQSNESGLLEINIRDFVTKQRIEANINIRAENFLSQFQSNPLYGNQIELKKQVYTLMAYNDLYEQNEICATVKNNVSLLSNPCKTSKECVEGYSCQGYLKEKVKILGKEYINETMGYCKLDLKVTCKELCSDECTLFLKKKAIVKLSMENMGQNLSLISINKEFNEFYSFPYRICLQYSTFDFDSVYMDLEKNDFAFNQNFDKCYNILNDSQIKVHTLGFGNITFFIQDQNFTFRNI